MQILMLSPAYPLPADNGAKRRILASVRHLSLHHEVTMVSLREHNLSDERPLEISHDVQWRDYITDLAFKYRIQTAIRSCFSTYSYGQVKYRDHKFQLIVERILDTQLFDCIWVHFLNMAPYVEQCFTENRSWRHLSRTIFVLDEHNVDEMYYRSFLTSKLNAAWRMYAGLETLKAKRLQWRWFPRFDAILCVSSDDLQKTAQYVDSRTSLWLAPNGVDIDYFQPIPREDLRGLAPTLVFGGSMDVAMNQDAVSWFCESILPPIKLEVPDVRFWIVGRNPSSNVRKLAERQGINVTGTVPDVRDYYRQAAVFVVPLRIGGGTKLKTIEAMAMSLPIVSTSIGAQGLEVASGRHLYIADSPTVFAERVIELLKNRDKAVSLGEEARYLVEQKYSWSSIMDEVDCKLIDLFHRRLKSQK